MIRFLLSGSYSVEENWRKTKTGGRETSKSCLFSFFPSASRFPHTKPPDAFLVWTCFPGTASLVWVFIPWLLTMRARVCSCARAHTHTHMHTQSMVFILILLGQHQNFLFYPNHPEVRSRNTWIYYMNKGPLVCWEDKESAWDLVKRWGWGHMNVWKLQSSCLDEFAGKCFYFLYLYRAFLMEYLERYAEF